MYITARERRILNSILSPYKEVTIKSLANELNVSARTIRRDLIKIKDTIRQFDLQLNVEDNIIRLMGSDKQKDEMLSVMDLTEYTKYERLLIILSLLFKEKDYIKLYALASETNTNTHICSKDLEELESYMLNTKSIINRKRGLGVIFESNEQDKRTIIFQVLKDYLRDFYLIPLIEGKPLYSIIPSHMYDYMDEFINPESLSDYIEEIEIIFGEAGQYISDENIIELAFMIAIIMKRLDHDYYIKDTEDEFDVTNPLIIKFSRQLKLSGLEVNYLANILSKYIQFDLFIDYDFDLRASVSDMISEVSEKVGYNFSNDYKLYSDLINHIDRQLKKINQYKSDDQRLIKDLMNEYLELFNILKTAVKNNFYHSFNEYDIGYIMLYFISKIEETQSMFKLKVLVVCAGGMGTSKMLVSRLKSQFINVVPINTSVSRLKDYDMTNFDLIISTVHLDLDNYFIVSPLLVEEDVSKIRKVLRKQLYHKFVKHKNNENYQALKSYPKEVLENVNITFRQFNSTEDDKRGILIQALTVLNNDHLITDIEKVYERLIKREKLGGLGIPGTKCALYHARCNNVKKPTMNFIYLGETQDVKAMTGEVMEADTYLMMLSPVQLGDLEMKLFNLISTLLIRDEDFITIIKNEPIQYIKQYIITKLKEVE
ncbi:BglG family transcription antiterminator [Haloplasma contractile]|uniref:PTS system nitrogen regulatory IIA component protein n=1 Tax=Haloplasma contractile SSD-17B TaxID=1033810 RepID=F7PW69_9MOLU|nr:PTS sugar transporter subunit IIA [Haloplasma contractile]ERJ11271.1 PTS system nitrogen regulatory IIA component protein [Haloplasma contractile SSD-17B]